MPCVVRRWHAELSQYWFSARLLNDATACGAWVPSSSTLMSPQFVVMTAVYVFPLTAAFSGSLSSAAVPMPLGGGVHPATETVDDEGDELAAGRADGELFP